MLTAKQDKVAGIQKNVLAITEDDNKPRQHLALLTVDKEDKETKMKASQ